jgi:signal transduction histidine kinase
MEEAGRWGAALRRRRVALLIAAAIPVLVLVGLPFSDVRWAPVAGMASIWGVFILVFDLLTATLLLGLYRQGAGFRLLLLACAFLWSASVVAMLAFSTGGVITAEPSFAAGSPGWLWLYRHVGPPLLIGLALMPWPASWRARLDGPDPSWGRAVAVAGAILLLGPGLLLVVLLAAPSTLPAVLDTAAGVARGEYPPWLMVLVLVVTVGSVAVSTVGVVLRGATSGIEVWALVAAVAWLGDVAFAFMYEDRFTVAYFGARLLAMAASAVVFGAILSEVLNLRQRLIAGNADLEGQIDALLEAQQLREHISAVLGHDMRAPIAGLQGYLEILDDEEVDPAFVRRIHQRCLVLVKRLSLLTEDLQAAALATNGDLEVLPELLDVETQLIECFEGFPGLDLRMDCQRGLVAWADPLRLQQILANLIRNAEKHGAEPVLVRVRSAPDGMVVFRVSDEGPGVPETFIPRLFERYAQGPDHAPGGSGLGLSVAHDLVRAHHGTVRYDLTDPAFIVTLPATPTEVRTPVGRVISPPRRLGVRTQSMLGGDTADAG